MTNLEDIDIRHFKLLSGEEVISFVIEDSEVDDYMVLQLPLKMHTITNAQNQSFYFTKWQPMAKEDVCIIMTPHIISFVECSDDIKEKYIKLCAEYRGEYEDDTDEFISAMESESEHNQKFDDKSIGWMETQSPSDKFH